MPELVDDERFRTVADRTRHRDVLEEIITDVTRRASSQPSPAAPVSVKPT